MILCKLIFYVLFFTHLVLHNYTYLLCITLFFKLHALITKVKDLFSISFHVIYLHIYLAFHVQLNSLIIVNQIRNVKPWSVLDFFLKKKKKISVFNSIITKGGKLEMSRNFPQALKQASSFAIWDYTP